MRCQDEYNLHETRKEIDDFDCGDACAERTELAAMDEDDETQPPLTTVQEDDETQPPLTTVQEGDGAHPFSPFTNGTPEREEEPFPELSACCKDEVTPNSGFNLEEK